MTNNIKKAADRAEWWKLIDAACEPYGGFVHVINSCGGSTVSMIWIETLKAAFASEAAREYWERGPEKQEGEMYVNVYEGESGIYASSIYESKKIAHIIKTNTDGVKWIGTYRLVKVETNQNE